MAALSPNPKLQFFDSNGNPLVGGRLHTYVAGSTSTPLVTFTDSTESSSNTNPIILDARGEANVWLGSAPYKLVLALPTDTASPPTSPVWAVDQVSANEAVNAGSIILNQSATYPPDSVGFNLGRRKAVFGTGIAAADVAALQAAVNAAPDYGVIDLFGTFATNAAITLKPMLTIRNGSNAIINHSNAATNLFQYVPGTPTGFPGQIHVLGLRLNGPGQPASGEVLGTLTYGNIRAAVHINANAPNCSVDCDIRGFFAGVVLRDVYMGRVGGLIFDCRHGIMLFAESHNTELSNPFVDSCTLTGLSINYGAGYTINQGSYTTGGAYQNTRVGIWLEGCQGFCGVGTTYFEGNTTADVVNGAQDAGDYNRSANFTKIDSIGTSSPCGAAQVFPLKVAAQGRNIQVNHSVDCEFEGLGFYSGSPTTTPHIFVDGFCDRTYLGVSFLTSTTPYDFDSPERVIINRVGATNFARDRNNGLTYGVHNAATPAGRGPWFGGGFSGRDSIILETLTANTDLLFRVPTTGQIRFSDNAGNELFSVDPINGRVNAMRPVAMPVYTVATLPAPSATIVPGCRAFVSNATVTTFGTVVVGGGANHVPVYVDGASNWRIG